jgi:hypothetical protein
VADRDDFQHHFFIEHAARFFRHSNGDFMQGIIWINHGPKRSAFILPIDLAKRGNVRTEASISR